MDLGPDGVEIPIGANLGPLDSGLAQIPAHVKAAEAKVPKVHIQADLSGANVVAQQAAAAVTTAGQAAMVKVNAVGQRIQSVSNQAAAAVAKAEQAGAAAMDSFGGMARFRQMRGPGGGGGGGGGGGSPPSRSPRPAETDTSGYADFLGDLNSAMGKRSLAGKTMKLLMGGGAIGAAAMGAAMIDDWAKKAESFAVAYARADGHAGELTAELLREIPIAGQLGDAMARVGGIISGSTVELARMRDETAKTDMVTAALAIKMEIVKDHAQKVAEHLEDWARKERMLGLSGIDAKLAGAASGFADRQKQTDEDAAAAGAGDKMKKLREDLAAARADEIKAAAAVSAMPVEGRAHMSMGPDQGWNEYDSDYKARKKREHSDATGRVKTLEKQLADTEKSIFGGWLAEVAGNTKLFGSEVFQAGKDEVLPQIAAAERFFKGFLSRGAAAIGEVNQRVRDAEKKLARQGMSEGQLFMADMKERTRDPATLANAQRTADKMDAAASARSAEESLHQRSEGWANEFDRMRSPAAALASRLRDITDGLKRQELNPDQARALRKGATADYRDAIGESLKYALPQAMKFGGSEMAGWQADLRMFMQKQAEKTTGDPAADSRNLDTIARAFDQTINVSLGGG